MVAILVFQNNEMAAMLVSKQILKTQARVKITPREKGETPRVSPFSRGVIFHARSCFVCSTIPEEKCGLLVV